MIAIDYWVGTLCPLLETLSWLDPTAVEVISPDEFCIVHVISRVVRRCFLLGDDPVTGKNYDYRKEWIENLLQHQAKHFGIDLLCFGLMSSHKPSSQVST